MADMSTDHADTVREALFLLGKIIDSDDTPVWDSAVAALDALVAERAVAIEAAMQYRRELKAAEARADRLAEALNEYVGHQSWRCEHPDRYSQDPDCPCGLVKTWRDLGFNVTYTDEGRAELAAASSGGEAT